MKNTKTQLRKPDPNRRIFAKKEAQPNRGGAEKAADFTVRR